MRNNIINVVGGLIIKNQKLLICQRTKNKDHGLKWEFPGGKIKNDETNEEALIREINEELSINIINYEELISYDFNYKDLNKKVFIYFYLVNNFSGKVLNNFHQKLVPILNLKVSSISVDSFVIG